MISLQRAKSQPDCHMPNPQPLVLIIALSFVTRTAAAQHAAAAKPEQDPPAQVEPLLNRLASTDPSDRRVAAVLLKNLPGEDFEAAQKASMRDDLGPDARTAVQAALPPLKA